MTNLTEICGWGRYPKQDARLHAPSSRASLDSIFKQENCFIARGMGRSYGDSANAPDVLQTTYINHFIEFDKVTGKLTAEAGITLRDILKVIVPKGWFLQ